MIKMKRIVLCADDYGQEESISQGIIALVEKKRLTATSCLVNSPYWESHARWLRPFFGQIDVGLHFNLTEGHPLSLLYKAVIGERFLSLSRMLRKAFLRQLILPLIEAELYAQLNAFTQHWGAMPDFIDGHQHIHQLAIVRDALLKVYQTRFTGTKTYVRWVTGKSRFNFKKFIIFLSGSRRVHRLLVKNHVPHNLSFSGIYDFSKARHYKRLFPEFLRQITDGGLILCHPGLSSVTSQDPIALARYEEYQYFVSPTFMQDCEQNKVILTRFF
jgi:predicted glycoside hydrolase/deacetylase ChbG (UPF0249 family)